MKLVMFITWHLSYWNWQITDWTFLHEIWRCIFEVLSISKRGNFEVCHSHKSINSGSGSASNSSREDLVIKKGEIILVVILLAMMLIAIKYIIETISLFYMILSVDVATQMNSFQLLSVCHMSWFLPIFATMQLVLFYFILFVSIFKYSDNIFLGLCFEK